MNKKYKPYIKVFIQIFLITSMSWAFSYMIHQTDGVVSAQELPIVHTCLKTNNDEICKEISASECNSQCQIDCIEATKDSVAECEIGTCFDDPSGVCSAGSPKGECESNGGKWGINLVECELGCCITGTGATFITERQCEVIQQQGVSGEFKKEIHTELECILTQNLEIEGACITGTGEDRTCAFVKGTVCSNLEKQGVDAEFYGNFLCTHPDLNMSYERNSYTGCMSGKEEVYWFDDQGNRENIWEGNEDDEKDSSWNNGLVKAKSNSCNLETTLGTITNLDSCGNCDMIGSSTVCSDTSGTAICEDISCSEGLGVEDFYEANGRYPQHGESWCYYQGSILPKEETFVIRDENRTNPFTGETTHIIENVTVERSPSTPGSRQFKMYCYKGEVGYEGCEDRRTGICEQKIIEREDESSYSTASCRSNLAMQCLTYNTWDNQTLGLEMCEGNPDCFVKEVAVPHSPFNFEVCASKYPLGFDSSNQELASIVCGLASMECESARVKKASGTVKTINRGCKRDAFTEQMNDFCMSLGDCGASVNYIGEYGGEGYSVSRSDIELKQTYIDTLKHYSEKIIGDYIPKANITDIYRSLIQEEGVIGDGAEELNLPENAAETFWGSAAGIGSGGLTLLSIGIPAGLFSISVGMTALQSGLHSLGLFNPAVSWVSSVSGAVVGAALAYALTAYWIKISGIGAGLSGSQYFALTGVAAAAGAILGYAIATGVSLGATVPVIGWVALAVILVVVAIMAWAGVGKVVKSTTSFECLQWSPPIGADDCGKCYDDGFGCSQYACESLGTACYFVNEGTSFEKCEGVKDDGNPPTIKALVNEEIPSQGFAYENETLNGFKVVSTNTEDGCIPAWTPVTIGLELNERGRCTISFEEGTYNEDEIISWIDENETGYNPEDFGLGDSFLGLVNPEESLQGFETDYTEEDESEWTADQNVQEFWFGGNNIYFFNHTHTLYYPSLEDLGLGGFSPDRRIDFDMKIRCEDVYGMSYPKDYVIRTCLSPEKDLTAPNIIAKEPSRGWIKHDAESAEFHVFTHEPADCRWSFEDKEYDLMENEFNCSNNPDTDLKPVAGGLTGFKCSSNTIIDSENVTLSVRCRDQPWLAGTENETQRNTNDKSENLTLKRSSPLNINSILLNNNQTLEFGTEPAVVEIKITTSGGADSGNAVCKHYAGSGYTALSQTGGKIHTQRYNQMTSGEKSIAIKCDDYVGNTVEEIKTFSITIDNEAPVVTRAYKEGTNLKLTTNENAICYYGSGNCDFEIPNENLMSVGLSKIHSTEWISGKTYYVRCQDKWSNWDSGCSIIVRLTDV